MRLKPKSWYRKHRRDTKVDLTRVRSAISVQRTLLLLIESGIVYWLIWVVHLPITRTTEALTEVITRQTLVLVSQLIGDTGFSDGMVYFTEGCLIALVVSS